MQILMYKNQEMVFTFVNIKIEEFLEENCTNFGSMGKIMPK